MIYIGNGIYSEATPNEYLQHYGVIGMKWGVRKARQHERNLYRHNRYNGMSKADAKAQYRANMQGVKQYAKANKRTGAKVSDISKASYDRANSKIKDYNSVLRSQKRRKIVAGLIGAATAAAAGYGVYNHVKARQNSNKARQTFEKYNNVSEKVRKAATEDLARADEWRSISKKFSEKDANRAINRYKRADKISDAGFNKAMKYNSIASKHADNRNLGAQIAGTGAAALGGLAIMNKVKNRRHTRRKAET